jgi:hypothetical protein
MGFVVDNVAVRQESFLECQFSPVIIIPLKSHPSVNVAVIILATSSVFKRTYKHTVPNCLAEYCRFFVSSWQMTAQLLPAV